MGQSITLLKKDFLELSLEIDRDVALEMSTGFGGSNRPTTVTTIPVTTDELKKIIDQLTNLYKDLLEAWKCPNCNLINRKDWTECNNCNGKKI
jgi:hypothetical protein